jgi:hypothetical protein
VNRRHAWSWEFQNPPVFNFFQDFSPKIRINAWVTLNITVDKNLSNPLSLTYQPDPLESLNYSFAPINLPTFYGHSFEEQSVTYTIDRALMAPLGVYPIRVVNVTMWDMRRVNVVTSILVNLSVVNPQVRVRISLNSDGSLHVTSGDTPQCELFACLNFNGVRSNYSWGDLLYDWPPTGGQFTISNWRFDLVPVGSTVNVSIVAFDTNQSPRKELFTVPALTTGLV